MALTVPNKSQAPADPQQARLFQADIDAMVAGFGGTGVLWGCAVAAQATPDATVAVAAGAVQVGGVQVSVAAGSVTMPAADATHPMWVLVTASSGGALAATAGTAAAAPLLPDPPAGSVALAAVWWPANDTTVAASQITDKRALTSPWWGPQPHDHGLLAWTYDVATVSSSASLVSGTVYLARVRVPLPIPVGHIWITTSGTPALTTGNYVGIYSTSGSLLAASADLTTALAGGAGNKQIALTSSISLAAGMYYVALLSTGTNPIAPRQITTATSPASLGVSGASLRWGLGPASQATLPASITMSSLSQTQYTFWAGLS